MSDGQPLSQTEIHRSRAILVCVFLLLATTVNYADRLTLNQLAPELMRDLQFDKKQYGQAEAAFGVCYALGAIVWGLVVDRYGPLRLYPIGVILWSLAGFATAYARDFTELAVCRGLLGFFEAINWACGLVITKKLLDPRDRPLGNGMFQSGTALGSIITPYLVLWLNRWYGWPTAFQFAGTLGFLWAAAWIVFLGNLRLPARVASTETTTADSLPLGRFLGWLLCQPRFWVMATMVVAINLNWHFFRAWMPLYLREARGMSAEQQAFASTLFYIASDAGAIGGGFLIQAMASRWGILPARTGIYFVFCLMTMASIPLAFIESTWVLWPCLILVGMGSLGTFPIYYAFSQDFTSTRQGIVTGVLGSWNWVVVSLMQMFMGWLIQSRQDRLTEDYTSQGFDPTEAVRLAIHDSYPVQIALSGAVPMVAFLVLLLLWKKR